MKFHELKRGDKFIFTPLPEELNDGEPRPFYVFIKTGNNEAVRLFEGHRFINYSEKLDVLLLKL